MLSGCCVLLVSLLPITLTTTALSAAKVAYGSGDAEKFAVRVTATTPIPTPADSVTVSANGKTLCAVTLRNGTGSCRLTATQLAKGTYKATARYYSAAPYAASSSAAKAFKVTS